MSTFIVISGSIGQDQNEFEFEDSAAGAETIAATIDALHVGIIIRDDVLIPPKSGEIDALIHRLANNLRERGYT